MTAISVTLTGCFMGELANRGQLNSPMPYLQRWEKSNMTPESRRQDWVDCGGRKDGDYSPDERLQGEKDDFAAAERTRSKLQYCMQGKGYRYVR